MSEIVYYGAAAIQVGSTVYGANAVQTTNVIVSGNVTASQFLGVGGFAVTTGCPTVGVTGNVYASNALTTTNVFATNVFATTVNVIGSVTASTFYGAHAGSNTASFSNIYSANAVTTTNLFANTLTLANASSTINVIGSVTASTFYGAIAGSNTVSASTFTGAGSGITSLNMDNAGSGTLAVARGGTGVTSSTGTGSVVLSAGPTLSGTVTGGTFSGTHTGDGSGITSLNMGNAGSGTLAVARGGTGVTSSTGTGSVVLSSGPTLAGTTTIATLNLTNALGTTYGGTGLTSFTSSGGLLYTTSTSALASSAIYTAGQVLYGGGPGAAPGSSSSLFWDSANSRLGIGKTNPGTALDVNGTVTATTFSGSAASLTSLPMGQASGTLAIANGGTGLTSFTSGGLLYASSTSALASSGAYTAGQVLYGGGAGAAPASSSGLFYDSANSRLGIGTSAVSANLSVTGNVYVSNALTTANIFVTGNVNVQGISNLYVANIAIANVSTLNVSSISVSGSTATPGYVLSATSLGLAWIAAGSSQWSGAAGNPIYYGPNVGIGTLSAPPASGSNLFVQGNVFVSNSITVSNILATGTISGTWTGTNQGILLTLGTSLTGVANFATSSDTPTLQAFHVPLQSFAQSTGFVSLFSVTAQGLIKFTSTGLYQITTVLAMNAPISRIAVGTNTSSTFPSVTNAYTYVYIIPSGTSPSAVITIPINVQNTGLWYYLDVFTQSSTTTASFYATASATITGSQFGTYVQIAPFGNYISSVGSQAAGLLVTPSTTVTLSSPITSNTYHVRMTSAANWTTSGASSSMQISTNGNLQFYQAGLYEVKVCLNATLYAATQFAIGSSASDSSLPSTQGPYVYQYAPNYTQDPSTAVVLPLNITDTTKFYYLDVSFPGSTTTVSVLPTSTFVSVAPIGSFIPTPMATASIVVAGVATALTGTYVATSADTYIGFTGGGTVTLPLGSTLTRGKTYTIKDESGLAGTNTTNLIKIQMSGTDLLDGYSSVTIQLNYAGLNVVWTGANSRWSFI